MVSRGGSRERRGWVVLHGITRPGRAHPELVRLIRAMASTGARVLVPEVHDWTELRFAPERAQTILRSAASWLHDREGTAPGGVILMGFSFGAPQALLAASDPVFSRKVRGVVAWGGYADVERVFRFSLTGEHEWEGTSYRVRPDPYLRWIVGANCLSAAHATADYANVAEALRTLASEAGDRRIPGGNPILDPMKVELRRSLPAGERELFDIFAPPADREPDPAAANAILETLTPIARREIPLLEPVPHIREIGVPVRLLHGRGDLIIPFTETLRAGRFLAPVTADLTTRITGLFAHSESEPLGSFPARAREGLRFVEALEGIFELT
ncbi:MAG: hypothetical protein EXR92_03420 [Gemmatimonadetes bacterium]|nr:hypothetical protein [Gemmatimonadota bacterium]